MTKTLPVIVTASARKRATRGERDVEKQIKVLRRTVEEEKMRAERTRLIAEAERWGGGGVGKKLRGNQHRRLCRHLDREPNSDTSQLSLSHPALKSPST